MASPSVSNISQLNASDANTWNSGTVGNANAAIPSGDLAVSTDGINPPNTCQQFEGSSVGYTLNNKYSAYSDSWTAVDISGANQAILIHFAGNPGQFNQVSTASDGITVYAFDSGANRTVDYLYEELGGSDDKFYRGAAIFFPVLMFSANATPAGSIDDTDIVEVGVAYKAGATGQYGVQFRIDQIIYINGEVSFDDGDGTTEGTWARYRALVEPEAASGSVYNGANIQVKPFYGWGFPVLMNSQNFVDSNFTFAFLPQDSDAAFNPPSSGYYSLTIAPSSSTATHSYTDGVFAYDSGTYPLDIDASSASSGSLDFTRCSFLNTGAVSLDGATLTMTACTFTNPASFSMQDADLDIAINNCTAAVQWTGDLVSGSTIETDSDIDITFAETDLSDITLTLTASNTITVSPTTGSGTYDLSGLTTTGTVTLDNATANNTTITLPAGTSYAVASPTAGGGTITVDSPAVTFTINSSESSSLIQIFTTTTQTLLDSTTGSALVFVHSGQTVDYVVQKAGFIPQRFTGVTLSGTTSTTVNLVKDPVYNASHGLTYTTDASWSRANNELTVPTFGPSVRSVYSLMIDSFISETTLRNTAFNIFMSGPNTMILTNDAEGDADSSIENMTAGGIRYRNTAGTATAEWCGIESIGTATGFTGEYQQVDGSGTTDARATGSFDEIIKIYGDASHGNFDYRGHLVLKFQPNGYYQSRVDVLDTYGISTLEPTHYIVAMQPVATGIATGDPAISITITDHTASPITVGGVDFDYEIIDNGANTAEDILREINYNLSLDTTYQGKDPFNYPDMVVESGGNYETAYGRVEGQDTATTYHGFYVSRSAADHPDFSRFQGNDASYYTPAVVNQVTITNLPADGANIMLQIYNITTATEIYAANPSGTSYSDTYTEGTDYTDGDEVRVRFAELNGTTSFKSFETIVTAGATGWSLNASNFLETDAVYGINAIDGSAVTKFTYSAVDDQFNLAVAQNFTAAELFAYYCYVLTTAGGIEGAFGAFVAQDAGNYRNVTSIADIFLDNETTASQRQTDTARIYKDDSSYPVLVPTTSGYGIDVNWQNVVYVVSTGGSALTAGEKAQLTSIESATAGLTYTIANKVDANIHYVNDIEVDGVGSAGDPWGPV